MNRQAIVPEQGGPTRASRALAMVHLAMYDAWRAFHTGIGNRYLPSSIFPPVPPIPTGEEDLAGAAAVGAAAGTVLSSLFVRQVDFITERRAAWEVELTVGGGGAGTISIGTIFGSQVGLAMIADRANDGWQGPGSYAPLLIPGTHRPDPYDLNQSFLHQHWGQVRPFGLAAIGSLNFVPPLGYPGIGCYLQSPEWPEQVEEVRRKGAAQDYADLDGGISRTAEETVIGIFWAYDGARELGTPPRLYNQCIRALSEQQGLSADQNAALFALVNMAMADAGIAAWREKYIYHVWRPVIGVREAAKGYGPGHGASELTFENSTSLTLPLPCSDRNKACAYEDIEEWLTAGPDCPTTAYPNEEPRDCTKEPGCPEDADGAEEETKGNEETNGGKTACPEYRSDPLWRPLGAPQTNTRQNATTRGLFCRTPNFPAYPSGHATFGAACFQIAFDFLVAQGNSEDDVNALKFRVVSDELNGRNRDPDGSVRSLHVRTLTLPQAIHENAVSRIYLGVHWRMDAVEGTRLGCQIADKIAKQKRGPASKLL